MEISVTRGLAELKLLKKRIDDKTKSTYFISEKKKSSKKISNIFTVDEFNTKVKADYQSIMDLIERVKIIKSAIVKFNAETTIEIAGKEMTVADAIERKNNIVYEKNLLNNMTVQYNQIIADVTRRNELMEQNLDNQIKNMMSGDNKNTDNDGMEAFSKTYRDNNSYDIIDPLNLKQKIDKFKENIENFENNVDFVLSEKNSSNKIEIPD